ncbi:MAG TPA: hypothetical protein PKC39_10420 [Ferruginibacter sp.]|nr:hypothetical protein [Ferruginibacter sp.]HMP21364.1 hypothetical protein [Ferruginibacter sp.]
MNLSSPFIVLRLPVYKPATYIFAALFITGNLLLPQLTHLIPRGGLIFLPIYFFTLIAAYKFGLLTGMLTAVFSPLINNWLFGMPPAFVLPIILVKSCLLAAIAAYVAHKSKRLSPLLILLVVLGYQVAGSFAEWAITQSLEKALQDFTLGLPGMLLQLSLGYLLLKLLGRYEF